MRDKGIDWKKDRETGDDGQSRANRTRSQGWVVKDVWLWESGSDFELISRTPFSGRLAPMFEGTKGARPEGRDQVLEMQPVSVLRRRGCGVYKMQF